MINRVYYFVDDISTPFVLKDIQKFAEKYERIYLFSCEMLSEKHLLPNNVFVFEEFVNWSQFNGIKILFRHLFSIINIYIQEIYATKKWIPLKSAIALLCSNIYKAEEAQRQVKEIEKTDQKSILYYSFWFYDSIYLAWIKRTYTSSTVITRAHSGDLYEDHISIKGKILFRNFQMKQLNGIFPVSEMGRNYLTVRYPQFANKIKTFFLGTEDPRVLNPFDSGKFVLVSCASLRHHKRIHRIAETLTNINFPLIWYHFGDENLQTADPKIPDYLKFKEALKLNPYITYFPMGQIDNESLLNFYKSHTVSLFISLSAVEGIPVSMMEAISFGIPVLSTDVGGCSEIVNEKTGLLIPLNTSTKEVANLLLEFKNSTKNTPQFRQNVREFWLNNFDEIKNYSELISEINKIA